MRDGASSGKSKTAFTPRRLVKPQQAFRRWTRFQKKNTSGVNRHRRGLGP